MNFIKAFKGLRPLAEHAQGVASPPYDVLSSAEAKELVQDKPLSFLHIAKPEIDLPEGTNLYSDEVYAKGKENLEAMIEKGVLIQDEKDCYYIYQMQEKEHVQTGLVAVASTEKYDKNQIAKHELTREDKEADRIKMISTMNAQASPVLLTCKPSPNFVAIASKVTESAATYEVTNELGVIHRLWVVSDDATISAIDALYNGENREFDKLYIADGHHRSASAAKIASEKIKANPDHNGMEPYNYFLSVIYPADQMKILDYNRVVKDLNGLSQADFLANIKKSYSLEESATQYKPAKAGEVGMYLAGQWYKLTLNPSLIPDDPSQALDVSTLYELVLKPSLAIGNPRTDKRIDFIGGIRGLAELEKKVNSSEFEVAFAMYPTQMQQIIDVADAGQIMPPKSTWFEPKLVDGLISHLLD